MKLLTKNARRNIPFELTAAPGSQVFVAGTFNDWNPTANPLKDNPDSGHFKAAIPLPDGPHEYKFIVNGTWTVDPRCRYWAINAHGSLNSVCHVSPVATGCRLFTIE